MRLKATADAASTADSPAAASRTRRAEAVSIPAIAARADRRPCPIPCARRKKFDGPGMTMMAAETRANASSVCEVGMTHAPFHINAVDFHTCHCAAGDSEGQAKISSEQLSDTV